jgi:hypothetical protein
MNKKQIKIIVLILQLFLVGALFLPAGIVEGSNKKVLTLSVFGMIDRYAGMGFSDDARFFMIFACFFPAAIILSIFFLKERFNFGTATILSAFYSAATACFFSAAKTRMVDYATVTILPYIIVIVSVLTMMIEILGFFYAYPVSAGLDKGNKE